VRQPELHVRGLHLRPVHLWAGPRSKVVPAEMQTPVVLGLLGRKSAQ